MSSKASTQVVIGGKVYTLSGYEEEEYLQKVAAYLNNKIDEFSALENYHTMSGDMKAILMELNVADDYFKAKTQVERLEEELEQKEKQIYDLKHELVSNQLKIEENANAYKALEKENKELLLANTKMEAALEQSAAVIKEDKKEEKK
ncbi:MAG: cell division protein ZapA [Lachnospiraceae bacterium]|uniref:cell division protein ZapA n=1 Tax=Roseburia hominis TaxID=301301 RepID=UPI001F3DE6FC|nr:cell division protein ZapA [Roseburia hominis]MCI5713620.1 cell division protein ZapA [Lachnospiraceae bacterium]MDD6169465.1 cell division protein ZapA [Lachnospiraceae bacterium]MDY4839915.1 cell division protein ZapA [Lachnospiraceae bacterium]